MLECYCRVERNEGPWRGHTSGHAWFISFCIASYLTRVTSVGRILVVCLFLFKKCLLKKLYSEKNDQLGNSRDCLRI